MLPRTPTATKRVGAFNLGALLMAAYLGVGSVYLSSGPRFGHICFAVVSAAGLAGSLWLGAAPVDAAALSALNGDSRSRVDQPGTVGPRFDHQHEQFRHGGSHRRRSVVGGQSVAPAV